MPNDDHEDLKSRRGARLVPRGYHLAEIEKGVYGESSKILEEVHELQDAEAQGIRIMVLTELSDIVGAIDGYLRKHFTGVSLDDLYKMATATRHAFESGRRT